MSDTSLRFNFLEGRNTVIPAAGKTAAAVAAMDRAVGVSSRRMQGHSKVTTQEIFRIDNAIGSSARRMASRAVLIGVAFAAAAGHAVALTSAIWPLVGALAAIPAVSVAGVAGLAALITGFSGLGAAMKKTGGGAGASASQIAAAQRRVEQANRSLLDSQEDLNDAFETARDRLRDIQTQYAGAQLDVEGAALAVREAELALREARSSGDRMDRVRADLALRQARLNQVEATNRLSDVEQEYNERLERGVDGSDEVREALRRQADATRDLAEAQEALNESMRPKGGGGEDAYAKLSASGKELVDTLRRLGPEWRKVQTATQEALFAGVAGQVQRLSDVWFPVMLRQLPAIAQGWNNMFASISKVASQQRFVDDMDGALGNVAVMWQRVGRSFGGFFSGFRNFVVVGSSFLPRLGSWVERLAMRFDIWSAKVRQTGEAYRWIDNAIATGAKLNELVKAWSRSLFEVFRLGQDATLIDRLIEGSLAFERWLKSAEGQERITQMWERMRDVGSAAWDVIKEAFNILSKMDFSPLATILEVVAGALKIVGNNMGLVNAVLGPLLIGMAAMKASAVVGSLAIKGLGLAMGTTATATGAATAAVGAFQKALGIVTVALIVFDVQKKESDVWNMRVKGSTDELAGSTSYTAEQFLIAAQHLGTYSDAVRAMTDPVFAFTQAQQRVADAQQRVNETAAEYGEGSPQHIQATRDLQLAVLELNSASVEAAKVNEEQLIPTLAQMEAQGLLAAGTTQAVADALALAKQRAEELDGTRATLYINRVVTDIRGSGGATGIKYEDGVQIMHTGGVVPGRRGEEVAAVLQAGEGVMSLQQMDAMRNGTGGGTQRIVVELDVTGAEDEMARFFRKILRVRGAKSFGLAPA